MRVRIYNNSKYVLACIVTGTLTLTIWGCSQVGLEPLSFVRWVENPANGLRVTKTMGAITYMLQYKPVEYIVAMEEKTQNLKKSTLNERVSELDGMQYYSLRLSPSSGDQDVLSQNMQSENDYLRMVNYFSFELEQDLYLVDGGDTLGCKLFHFVRDYGIGQNSDFVLGFDIPESQAKKTQRKVFVIDDHLFENGIIKLEIDANDLEEIPELISYIGD